MAPAYAKSDGKAAGKLLGACGMRLDQWQGDMLVDWMARDAAGRGMSYLRRVGASAEWQVSAGAGAGRCGDAAVPGACDLYGAFAENGHGDL